MLAVCAILPAKANPVKVKMDSTSPTMTLVDKATGATIETGAPNGEEYDFDVAPGRYVLTAKGKKDNITGTIEVEVGDSTNVQVITVLTNTVYATNLDENKNNWVYGTDYDIDVKVFSREGVQQVVTLGESTTAGRKTVLALNGNSLYVTFIPSDAHKAEGYVNFYKSATLTRGINVSGTIPKADVVTVTVPEKAYFELNIKFGHYVDFTRVEPESEAIVDGKRQLKYRLAFNQAYNFRTSIEGGITRGGIFTMKENVAQRPDLTFDESLYKAFKPDGIKHDVKDNGGYETGDIFVNINPRNHLVLKQGDTYKLHGMRTWQLTENQTNNYFIEPDFHYTILGLDGKPSTGVVSIEQKQGSAWADLKATGNGTAIVLVTYDAIGLQQYTNNAWTPYMGGEIWSAIWPENTAAFVVSVGQTASTADPNMVINEKYNDGAKKMAGKYVDTECDVFYYLEGEDGFPYTFKPINAASVTIAYPTIGEHSATYSGFGTEGVTKNEDGSYTVLLKEGRQIVCVTDAAGNAAYQVLTAKPCRREITNVTRPGSKIIQPGDQVKIQYSGLRHPANKLAGIYNMSAYVTYNGIPNGSSLILGSGQYTFGSAASAQAVTVDIPADYDVAANPELVMDEGVIQVKGFGDPIGNHRYTDPIGGRSPNFTAIAHETYFGAIPEVRLPISQYKTFNITVSNNVSDAELTVTYRGNVLTATDGVYTGSYGDYAVVARKEGYRCFRHTFTIPEGSPDNVTFNVEMELLGATAWDGKTVTTPVANADGVYEIGTGAELAGFARVVASTATAKGVLTADIDLANFDWTPIGATSSKTFMGEFNGAGHKVRGLYINVPAKDYQGLFGYATGTAAAPVVIKGITVTDGSVEGKSYIGAILGHGGNFVTISECANYADITAAKSMAGGIAGRMNGANECKLINCYNTGKVISNGNHAGIVGAINAKTVITKCYNIGEIADNGNAGAISGTTGTTRCQATNCYADREYPAKSAECTIVTAEQIASGELAYKLGDAFGQKIGTDAHPVLGGAKVYYDATDDRYTNSDPSGVEDISADSEVTVECYYDIRGIASDRPFRGVNFVRYSNGEVRKLIVR